jgi:hypothetical protein
MRRALRTTLMAALFGAVVGVCGFGGLGAFADAPKGGYAPDPPARPSKLNWVFEVTARGGKVTIDRVKGVSFEKPVETPRVVGRFALELYVGRELLDRVRFNVPLMGGETSIGNRNNLPKPRFEQNVTAHVQARMADNTRAAYLLVIDRDTGETQKYFWPPSSDGRLIPWQNPLSTPDGATFPDGGVRAAGLRDAGAGEAGRDGG